MERQRRSSRTSPSTTTTPRSAKLLDQIGVTKDGQTGDNLHDDPGITMNMFITDPRLVRWDARVKAGKATINGVSIADKAKTLETATEDRRHARHEHRGRDQEGDREQGKGDEQP